MCTAVTAMELDCTLNIFFCFHSKILDAKMLFLAVCHSINKEINLQYVHKMTEFGVLFRPGNSIPDRFFTFFKRGRLSAVFHDAFAFMNS